jgi:hypothetical protein
MARLLDAQEVKPNVPRVKSAGPGVSRALSEKIALCRGSSHAREELNAKVKSHIKVRGVGRS